jgi:5-formyltetrahydrofolate cyclo-ligase
MANQKSDSDEVAIALLKKEWRRRLKKIRQELDPQRRERASTQACKQLSQWCKSARFVLSFASFGSEIDLWPFNRELASEGRLVLPRLEKNHLHLFHLSDISHLESHPKGWLEPQVSHCFPIDFSLIDIALIPGLGFDLKTKYRLGYGLGCYDRLLAAAPSLQTWGIGFLEQAVEQLPYTLRDIPLKEIYLF